jgi:hypothetical protein
MTLFSRVAVTVLVILVVTLGVTTLAFSKRLQDTSAQLEQAQARLQQLKGSGEPGLSGSEGRLRELLNQQEAANNQLRDEIARLKQDGATDFSPKPAVAGDSASRPSSGGRGGAAAWMDRLRQEDPERYKQIIQQREERRKTTDLRYQETIDQLDQRAQSAPTQAEADLVGQIADTLAKLNDLRQKWQAIRDLPDDQRQAQTAELAAQTRQTTDQLRDLSQQDRTLQLQKFARDLGVTDDNGVQSFVDGITSIYSNTNIRAIIGGGGPGGGGRGDGAQGQTPPTPRP